MTEPVSGPLSLGSSSKNQGPEATIVSKTSAPAHDFTDLFGEGVLDSLSRGPLSIEEILSGTATRQGTTTYEAPFGESSSHIEG